RCLRRGDLGGVVRGGDAGPAAHRDRRAARGALGVRDGDGAAPVDGELVRRAALPGVHEPRPGTAPLRGGGRAGRRRADGLGVGRGPAARPTQPSGANMMGYVTVTIPPSGGGKVRPRNAARTQARTASSGIRGCFEIAPQPRGAGERSSSATALTAPEREMTK